MKSFLPFTFHMNFQKLHKLTSCSNIISRLIIFKSCGSLPSITSINYRKPIRFAWSHFYDTSLKLRKVLNHGNWSLNEACTFLSAHSLIYGIDVFSSGTVTLIKYVSTLVFLLLARICFPKSRSFVSIVRLRYGKKILKELLKFKKLDYKLFKKFN